MSLSPAEHLRHAKAALHEAYRCIGQPTEVLIKDAVSFLIAAQEAMLEREAEKVRLEMRAVCPGPNEAMGVWHVERMKRLGEELERLTGKPSKAATKPLADRDREVLESIANTQAEERLKRIGEKFIKKDIYSSAIPWADAAWLYQECVRLRAHKAHSAPTAG